MKKVYRTTSMDFIAGHFAQINKALMSKTERSPLKSLPPSVVHSIKDLTSECNKSTKSTQKGQHRYTNTISDFKSILQTTSTYDKSKSNSKTDSKIYLKQDNPKNTGIYDVGCKKTLSPKGAKKLYMQMKMFKGHIWINDHKQNEAKVNHIKNKINTLDMDQKAEGVGGIKPATKGNKLKRIRLNINNDLEAIKSWDSGASKQEIRGALTDRPRPRAEIRKIRRETRGYYSGESNQTLTDMQTIEQVTGMGKKQTVTVKNKKQYVKSIDLQRWANNLDHSRNTFHTLIQATTLKSNTYLSNSKCRERKSATKYHSRCPSTEQSEIALTPLLSAQRSRNTSQEKTTHKSNKSKSRTPPKFKLSNILRTFTGFRNPKTPTPRISRKKTLNIFQTEGERKKGSASVNKKPPITIETIPLSNPCKSKIIYKLNKMLISPKESPGLCLVGPSAIQTINNRNISPLHKHRISTPRKHIILCKTSNRKKSKEEPSIEILRNVGNVDDYLLKMDLGARRYLGGPQTAIHASSAVRAKGANLIKNAYGTAFGLNMGGNPIEGPAGNKLSMMLRSRTKELAAHKI